MTTMNFNNFTRIALVAMSLGMASSAFAASNSGSMTVAQPVRVNGVQLAPGEYRVKWEGAGDNVTVTILEGKKVVATAPAHLVEIKKVDNNSYLATPSDSGVVNIAELRFAGKTQALDIGDEMAKLNTVSKSGTK